MDLATVMKTLESKGKPGAAKIYARHGVKEPAFGVSYADLGALAREWIDAPKEYASSAGWTVLSVEVGEGRVPEADARRLLARIEKTIHGAANRTRHAMNGALIAIGGAMESLRADAIADAKRNGRVEVDHGDTDCETPDAPKYIAKIAARGKKRAPAAKKS